MACIALSSCVDTVILPDDKILDEDYWKKGSEVNNVMSTAYAQLRGGDFLQNYTIWTDFRSDELRITDQYNIENNMLRGLKEIYSMQMRPDNMFLSWAPLYSCINYCNLVLENIDKTLSLDPDFTQGDYEAAKAQMKSLRAYCYFTLVRCFRDVPVTPHAYLESSDNLMAPQMAPEAVLQMCIADLQSALPNAPVNNAYGDARDRGYINKDAINAMLADIYLWLASVHHEEAELADSYYKKCIECCDMIIAAKKAEAENNPRNQDKKDYYLSSSEDFYTDLFGSSPNTFKSTPQNADESIFEIQRNSSSNANTVWSTLFHVSNAGVGVTGYLRAVRGYGKSGSAANYVFKSNTDQRLFESVFEADDGNVSMFYVRKYVAPRSAARDMEGVCKAQKLTTGTAERNWIVYRLTDVMLMKAEALVQLKQYDDAYALIRVVNDRAQTSESNKLPATVNPTYADEKMEELVMLERARELCFEGKRWFDLLRYNYRRMTGINYSTLMADMNGNFPYNSEAFFKLAFTSDKYGDPGAVTSKMPTEPYLYMPIAQQETEVNTNIRQNPVFPNIPKK